MIIGLDDYWYSFYVYVYLVVYIVGVCICTGALRVVFVPLHSAGLGDCHFRHVCLHIFGSQLQFVRGLAVFQLITKADSISLCACESVCMH